MKFDWKEFFAGMLEAFKVAIPLLIIWFSGMYLGALSKGAHGGTIYEWLAVPIVLMAFVSFIYMGYSHYKLEVAEK